DLRALRVQGDRPRRRERRALLLLRALRLTHRLSAPEREAAPRTRGARRCARDQLLGLASEIASTRSPVIESSMLRAMSAWESIPTRSWPSITGRRRTWCVVIVFRASWIES